MEDRLESLVDMACSMAEVEKINSPLRPIFMQVISAWDKGRSGKSIVGCENEFGEIAAYYKIMKGG